MAAIGRATDVIQTNFSLLRISFASRNNRTRPRLRTPGIGIETYEVNALFGEASGVSMRYYS
jgi:hypothetical protein